MNFTAWQHSLLCRVLYKLSQILSDRLSFCPSQPCIVKMTQTTIMPFSLKVSAMTLVSLRLTYHEIPKGT